MSARLRKLPPVLLACSTLLVLGACGDSHTKVTTGTYAGESGKNAPYLDVGPLSYQVQLSRQLNPANSEDAAYLQGLTPAQRQLGPTEEWFAVFMQVYNRSSSPAAAAPPVTGITISDTQGNTYQAIQPALTNNYAYRGGTVRADGQIPEPDTPQYFAPTQGAMLLFKIRVQSLSNRPITVRIRNPFAARETA